MPNSPISMRSHAAAILLLLLSAISHAQSDTSGLAQQCRSKMRVAANAFQAQFSVRGGYVYYYSPDGITRLGEGVATASQVWVQPPGTPTVGGALLDAYIATEEQPYLDAAFAAGKALMYGQLKSGGWQNAIDFDQHGARTNAYRNGKGKGRNYSTLDDAITQSALRFLIRLDQATQFAHADLSDCVQFGLANLLDAQFANGAFPQVFDGSPSRPPLGTTKHANFPNYDWRTENRVKEYWNLYTLNDNVASSLVATLRVASNVYEEAQYLDAITKLGEFLIAAQLPHPQPAWAQQYNFEMVPCWARKFEPPAVASSESQDAIDTLLTIYELTGDSRFLSPIPKALKYLSASVLTDGRLSRFYELQSNRPLYMRRKGKLYFLTYDDSQLPRHYGWKIDSRIQHLQRRYDRLTSEQPSGSLPSIDPGDVETILKSLDNQGRWVSTYSGQRLTGQPKFAIGEKYISSAVFAANVSKLSLFITEQR